MMYETYVTDARVAHALFVTMHTEQLRELRAAHLLDLQFATTPESIAFGAGRIALIDAVLTARGHQAE